MKYLIILMAALIFFGCDSKIVVDSNGVQVHVGSFLKSSQSPKGAGIYQVKAMNDNIIVMEPIYFSFRSIILDKKSLVNSYWEVQKDEDVDFKPLSRMIYRYQF